MKTLVLAMGLLLSLVVVSPASAQTIVSVQATPPPLPVHAQQPCPAPGYLWTPGYWAWSTADHGYFWVSGSWVLPPQPGDLWTPGYWAWDESRFVWRPGYWGSTVGFYGGIDYGYGYPGTGYHGGYWHGGRFYYNRAVNNVNVTVIHTTYRRTVIQRSVNRVSYNGGHGGSSARPGPEPRGTHERRTKATQDRSQ